MAALGGFEPTCPVCFELTTDTLVECGHALCHVCARRWLVRRPNCPTCRAPTAELVVAPPAPLSVPFDHEHRQVHFATDGGDAAYVLGLYRGPPRGVVVRILTPCRRDAPHHLREHDVITHIDGARHTTACGVAAQLDRAIDEGAHLVCTVLVLDATRDTYRRVPEPVLVGVEDVSRWWRRASE